MHEGQTVLFFEVRTDKTLVEFYALNKKRKSLHSNDSSNNRKAIQICCCANIPNNIQAFLTVLLKIH